MTDVRANGGQHKWLPAFFALAVAGAGVLAVVITEKQETRIAAPAVLTHATTSVAAGSTIRPEPAHHDSQQGIGKHALEIERALISNNQHQREAAFNVALPELLSEDPSSVVDLVARQEGEARSTLRDEVVRQWIRRDRNAAVMWIGSFDGEERDASAIIAMRTLAAIDPAQAVAVANEFNVGRDDGSLEHIVQIWATEKPEECLRWLESQPENPQTAQLRARVEPLLARSSTDQRD